VNEIAQKTLLMYCFDSMQIFSAQTVLLGKMRGVFSPSEGRGLGVRGVTSRGESADKSERGAVVPFGSLADVACHAYKR